MRKILTFSLLLLSAAHTEISFQAIKGIHFVKKEDKKISIFQEGCDHLSPIWGFLAIKTGMIENLRFFGPYEFGWNEKDPLKREYSKDKGRDGITKLVRILFPSTGGQLTTTAEHKSNLGKYLTSSIIAEMLNGIQKLRKGEEFEFKISLNEEADYKEINRLFYNKEPNGVKIIDKFQDSLKKLFQDCLENEKKGLDFLLKHKKLNSSFCFVTEFIRLILFFTL